MNHQAISNFDTAWLVCKLHASKLPTLQERLAAIHQFLLDHKTVDDKERVLCELDELRLAASADRIYIEYERENVNNIPVTPSHRLSQTFAGYSKSDLEEIFTGLFPSTVRALKAGHSPTDQTYFVLRLGQFLNKPEPMAQLKGLMTLLPETNS